MNYPNKIPKYLRSLIFFEENLNRMYRSNNCEKNRIKHGLVQLVARKVTCNWHKGLTHQDAKRILENYIGKLVGRVQMFRLSSTVGNLEIAHMKYEATQSAVLILLEIHKEMVEED